MPPESLNEDLLDEFAGSPYETIGVRVIVDAMSTMSNPGVQTQWMYFDLKQNGIEVTLEDTEAFEDSMDSIYQLYLF
ncbi:MAG: hypothetical protein U5R30_17480 [Deltaproteobacteria bacterium]|nr:hypothetical protein [Deltaproteobacteria bacterium]